MKLPTDWLLEQLDAYLTRGRIIRFRCDDLDDPSQQTRFKFAVILNRGDVLNPIYYAFATSKTAFYDSNPQFESVILRLPSRAYPCFPEPTILTFRDVRIVSRESLRAQYLRRVMTLPCELSSEHLAAVDQIIRESPYIQRRLKQFVLPPSN